MSTNWSHCPNSAGNSLSALLDGKATLTFLNWAEDYTLTMPYAHCKGERSCYPHPKGRAQAGSPMETSGPCLFINDFLMTF